MAARSTFPIFDQAIGGGLETLLKEWRKPDPPMSFAEIAHTLRAEHEVLVTDETVRRWCVELGIHDPKTAA